MPTYVNDLRLKEIATGDEAGTWGNSTNTNLELIGEALGFGTEAITTNADTHTTTVADGATDPGRAMYLKYTGTLDSACTITIAPNTMSRMHFIENGTSGSQNIIISQGTGANVTIPAGDVKAVYLDGAGSGAAVADAFASLNTVDLKVEDDLTVTDDVSIGGALTLTGNGDFNGDLDVDGTTNLDVVDIDGAVDMASTLQVDGSITSSDGATITVNDNSIALSLISTDADANEGPGLVLYRNSSSAADDDVLGQIYLQGENDADQKVTYGLIQAVIADASDGSEDVKLSHRTMVAGTERERMTLTPSVTVFNEDSQDIDFRVESDDNANMLFVDGGEDRVGIGTGTPQAQLDLTVPNAKTASSNVFSYIGKTNESTNYFALQAFQVGASAAADRQVQFQTIEQGVANAGIITLQLSGGQVALGRSTADKKLDVSGDIRASTGIYFGTDTAAANALDDYEEGNATLTFATSDTQYTTASQSDDSTYTRIGNQVTLFVSISIASPTGGTGALRLTGLPFANNGPQVTTSVCSMGRMANSQTQRPFGLLPNGSDVITFFFNADGAVASSYSATNLNGQVTPFMNCTITYTT